MKIRYTNNSEGGWGIRLVALSLAMPLLWPAAVFSAGDKKDGTVAPLTVKKRFTTCVDKNLGYIINCSPDWDLEVKPKSIMLVVSGEPQKIVTVTVTKFDESGLSLADLTPRALQNIFKYSDYFKVGKTTVAGQKGLIVLASPAFHPEVQLVDYLLIRNTNLYRVSFSVNTKKHFEEYKPLFVGLIRSFRFFDPHEASLTLQDSDTNDTAFPR